MAMSYMDRCTQSRICWLLPLFVWTLALAVSGWWSIEQKNAFALELAKERGHQMFRMVQLTREWNAGHGGVYVPVSPSTQPNPYLKDPRRDVETTDGRRLTKINPAYMTRQISGLARSAGVIFHLTSLKPLNPANRADKWETSALESFEQGLLEKGELIRTEKGVRFRYMAPLYVKQACLKCHHQQGYRLGDIRGGLSVNLNANKLFETLDSQYQRVIGIHVFIWFLGGALILFYLNANRRRIKDLSRISSEQSKTIEKKSKDLKKATKELDELSKRENWSGLYNRSHFRKMLRSIWNDSVQRHAHIGLILAEIDYFKEYNEEYGMLEGDVTLRRVAQVMRQAVNRPNAVSARYDGATFVFLLPDTEIHQAAETAEIMLRAVRSLQIKHDLAPLEHVVSLSIGVAGVKADSSVAPEALFRSTEKALNGARRNGRDQVFINKS